MKVIPKTRYVCGFMFDRQHNHVVLIEKKRPAFTAGMLNGVGGHVEEGEEPLEAMLREFQEEAGHCPRKWTLFFHLDHYFPEYAGSVDFYWSVGDTSRVRTMTDEPLQLVSLKTLHALPNLMPNLTWLVPMALQGTKGVGIDHYRPFELPVMPDCLYRAEIPDVFEYGIAAYGHTPQEAYNLVRAAYHRQMKESIKHGGVGEGPFKARWDARGGRVMVCRAGMVDEELEFTDDYKVW